MTLELTHAATVYGLASRRLHDRMPQHIGRSLNPAEIAHPRIVLVTRQIDDQVGREIRSLTDAQASGWNNL